ncbi:CHAD domain-containing protein [Bradyrhizobium sp. CCGUVB1N3]|uniref:CHAD domain-containing protein n=1 Tax=Bradyrhizobium sp. CCGUVB1N3 TaxID=2949629 RepID=UPI003531E2E8
MPLLIATEDAKSPLCKFASRLLHRHIKKMRRQGRHLDEMSARERRKLRIRAKKIRYALEFFESLFRSRRERKQMAGLSFPGADRAFVAADVVTEMHRLAAKRFRFRRNRIERRASPSTERP